VWRCHANADPDGHGNGYAHSDRNTNGYSDSYAYTDSYCYRYSDSYAYADSYGYCDSNGYAYADSYAYFDAYDPTESKPDTKAASDTAASTVGPILNPASPWHCPWARRVITMAPPSAVPGGARASESSHCLPAVCGKVLFTREDLRSWECDPSSHHFQPWNQIPKAARGRASTPKLLQLRTKRCLLSLQRFNSITSGLPNPRSRQKQNEIDTLSRILLETTIHF
jgi:hypothetical protein